MNLFVCGVLVLPEVMQNVTGRTFRVEGASLHGYAQLGIEHDAQAALLPFPDCATEGVVCYDLDEAAVASIDAFHGRVFERVEVTVEAESGKWVEAESYVVRLSKKKLLHAGRSWSGYEFRKKHLKQFLETHPPAQG